MIAIRKYLDGKTTSSIRASVSATQPGQLVQRSPASVCVSLHQSAQDRSSVAESRPHRMSISWVDSAQQLSSRGDMDLSHTKASHAGADAGHPRHVDNGSRLETPNERESTKRPPVAARDTTPNEETQRDLHLVGRGKISKRFTNCKSQKPLTSFYYRVKIIHICH